MQARMFHFLLDVIIFFVYKQLLYVDAKSLADIQREFQKMKRKK